MVIEDGASEVSLVQVRQAPKGAVSISVRMVMTSAAEARMRYDAVVISRDDIKETIERIRLLMLETKGDEKPTWGSPTPPLDGVAPEDWSKK